MYYNFIKKTYFLSSSGSGCFWEGLRCLLLCLLLGSVWLTCWNIHHFTTTTKNNDIKNYSKTRNKNIYRVIHHKNYIAIKLTTARWTPSPFRFCASLHCGSESTNSCLKRFTMCIMFNVPIITSNKLNLKFVLLVIFHWKNGIISRRKISLLLLKRIVIKIIITFMRSMYPPTVRL